VQTPTLHGHRDNHRPRCLPSAVYRIVFVLYRIDIGLVDTCVLPLRLHYYDNLTQQT